MIQTIVCDGWKELGDASFDYLRGPNVAISGGSTFANLFRRWVAREKLFDCSFFPVDERCVPITDEASNWGQARRLLFEPLGRIEDLDNFAASRDQFEQLLRNKVGDPIIFDTVMLGVGDDGHTASLFPDSAALDDGRSPVVETRSPTAPHRRISLGLSVLWAARSLLAVVAGEGKRPIVERLLRGDRTLPITIALEGHPAPVVLIDRSAYPSTGR